MNLFEIHLNFEWRVYFFLPVNKQQAASFPIVSASPGMATAGNLLRVESRHVSVS